MLDLFTLHHQNLKWTLSKKWNRSVFLDESKLSIYQEKNINKSECV